MEVENERIGYVLNAMTRSVCTDGVMCDEHAHAVGVSVIKCITEKYRPSGYAVCYSPHGCGGYSLLCELSQFFFFLLTPGLSVIPILRRVAHTLIGSLPISCAFCNEVNTNGYELQC